MVLGEDAQQNLREVTHNLGRGDGTAGLAFLSKVEERSVAANWTDKEECIPDLVPSEDEKDDEDGEGGEEESGDDVRPTRGGHTGWVDEKSSWAQPQRIWDVLLLVRPDT